MNLLQKLLALFFNFQYAKVYSLDSTKSDQSEVVRVYQSKDGVREIIITVVQPDFHTIPALLETSRIRVPLSSFKHEPLTWWVK